MTIIIFLSFLIGVGVIGYRISDKDIYPITTFASGILLFVAILTAMASQMENVSKIKVFVETQSSIKRARDSDLNMIEDAALQHKVIECNQWLVSAKYWNSTIFDMWIPDAIETLKPLE